MAARIVILTAKPVKKNRHSIPFADDVYIQTQKKGLRMK